MPTRVINSWIDVSYFYTFKKLADDSPVAKGLILEGQNEFCFTLNQRPETINILKEQPEDADEEQDTKKEIQIVVTDIAQTQEQCIIDPAVNKAQENTRSCPINVFATFYFKSLND